MIELYRAGGQLWKVRLLTLALLALAAFACVAGLWVFNNMNDGAGGRASFAARLGMGMGIPLLFLPMAAVMVVYGWYYLAKISYDPASETLHFQTVALFGHDEQSYKLSEILPSHFVEGRFDDPIGYGPSVHAPWYKVRVRGRKWPFILDKQGKFLDRKRARELLKL